jgi:ATP-dependent Zn protease
MAICDEKTRMVALHEAGHAVMAIRNGIPVTEVSIIPNGILDGYCRHAAGY